MNGRPISDYERKFLQENYQTRGAKWCAEQLGRSRSSIYGQIYKMDLGRHRKVLTDEQIESAKNGLSLNTARQMVDTQATVTDLTNWQSSLRAAMVNAIDEDDMAVIVKAQVAKAKQGDERALKFVLEVVGAKNPVTITNNLIVDAEAGAKLARNSRQVK